MNTARMMTAFLILAACGEPATGPIHYSSVEAATAIEHEVRVESIHENGAFVLSSVVRNGGLEEVTLTLRTCFTRTSDVMIDRGQVHIDEPLMLCSRDHEVVTLGPGEESKALTISGRAEASGSTPELRIRHLLQPERWTTIELNVPG